MDDVMMAAREHAYRLFTVLLREEPDDSILDILKDPGTYQRLAILASGDVDSCEASAVFRSVLAEMEQNCRYCDDVDRLRDEYTRLFIGPCELVSPPWESAYEGKGNVIMQESTLEVRKCYLREKLLPLGHPRVADDHISLELDFMARMSGRLLKAHDAHDAGEVARIVCVQQEFLDEHLLSWVPRYRTALDQAARSGFYPMVITAVGAFLKVDRELMATWL